MNRDLSQTHPNSLFDHPRTLKRVQLNHSQALKNDQTDNIARVAENFHLDSCLHSPWNPENYSLMYNTALWNEASPSQRLRLNQLYWVAYYSQIISAEIATIFFNATCASGLYGIEDFKLVCDSLDLESRQERTHIAAFKKVAEDFEAHVFGERIFTYPMRTPFCATMVFSDTRRLKEFWRNFQLRAFTLLSSGSAYIASQYFAVRGIRTLNGKQVQHQLSMFFKNHPDKDAAPDPAKVSYYHFVDESFHFNSSMIIAQDILHCLAKPTKFEEFVANSGLSGCQRDHFNFSTLINGIFWYDPAAFRSIYKVLRSPVFGMDHAEALHMMERCFTQESEGMHQNAKTHADAIESYKLFAEKLPYASAANREMSIMSKNNLARHLKVNRRAFAAFKNLPAGA